MAITDEEIDNFLSTGAPKPTSGDGVLKDLSKAQLADYFAGKPLPKSGPGFISDIGNKLVSGTGTGISSLGWLAGIKSAEDYGNEMAQGAEMAMSPAGIERSQREIFPTAAPGEGVMGLGFNPAGLAKIPYAIAESTPGMVAGMVGAAGAAAVLPEAAIAGIGSLTLRALGPLAGRVAASSLGEAGLATAANSGINVLEAAAPLLGKRLTQTGFLSTIEGVQAGAMNGQRTEQEATAYLTANPKRLEETEIGRASLKEANGDIPAAIKMAAARLGIEAAYKVTPSTALLALPGGYLESRLLSRVASKGMLKEAGIGAIGEAAQEGPQSSAEEYLSGNVMGQIDPSQIPTLQTVARAGLEGALIGAPMGGGLGLAGSAISPAEKTVADVDMQAQQELFAKLQTFVAGRNLYEPQFSEAPIIETRAGDQISVPTLLAYADTITDTSDPIYAINKQTADPGERAALLAEIMHPNQIQEAKKMGEQAKAAEEAAASQAETDRANAEWEQTQQRMRQIDEENATRQAAGQEELLAGAAATRPTSAPEGSTEELMNIARDFWQNLGPTSYQDHLTPYSEIANSLIEEQPAGEMFSTQVLQRRVEELALSPIDIKTTEEILDQYSTDVEDPSISAADKPLYKDPEGYYYKRGEVPGTPGPEYARRRRRRPAAAAAPAVDMSDVMPEIAEEPTPPAVSEEEYNNVRLSLNDEIARIAAAGRGGERAADAVRRALRNKNFNAPQLLAAINIAKDQSRILGGISSARPVTQFLENLTDDSGAGAQGVRYGRTKNSVAGLIQYSLAPDQISFSNQTGVHEALHVVQSLLKAYDPNTYRIVANDFTGENGAGISVSQIPGDIQRKLKLLTPEKGGKVSYWDMLNAEFGANAPEGNQNAFAEHPDESMAYTFAMLDDARRRGYKMGGLKPAYLRLLNLFSQIQKSVQRMLGGARTADEILSRISTGTLEAPGVPGRRFGAEQPRKSARRNAEFSARKGSIEPTPEESAAERSVWEGRGLVRDKDGKPLTLYTGTSKDTIFKAFKVPENGLWLTSDPKSASDYAEYNDSQNLKYNPDTRSYDKVNTASRVIPLNAVMEKPLIVNNDEWTVINNDILKYGGDSAMGYRRGQKVVFNKLRAEGYDGVQFPEAGLYIILRDPNQAKSIFNKFPKGAATAKEFSKRAGPEVSRRDFMKGVAAAIAASGIPKPVKALTAQQEKGLKELQALLEKPIETGGADLPSKLYARDLDGALKWITENSKNNEYKRIAAAIMKGGLGNTRLAILPGKYNVAGVTSLEKDGRTKIELTTEDGLNEETLLHEALHAYVQQRWMDLSMYSAHNKSVVKDSRDRADAIVKRYREVWETAADSMDKSLKENNLWASEFASSPDEGLAWSMTNPDVQAYLKTVNLNGGKIEVVEPGDPNSLWNQFLQWLADLLGIQPSKPALTALDWLMDAGNNLIEAGEQVAADASFGKAIYRKQGISSDEDAKAEKRTEFSKRKALKLPAGMSEKDYVYGRMADTTTDAFLKFFKESAVSDTNLRTILKMVDGQRHQVFALAPKVVYHSGSYDETTGDIPMEGKGKFPKDGMHFGSRQSADERNLGKLVDDMTLLVTAYKENGLWHWTDGQGTTSEDLGETGWKNKQEAIDAGRNLIVREFADNYDPSMDFGNAPPLTAVYLSIQNPKTVRDQGHDWTDAIAKAKAEGYDGIVYKNLFEDVGSESYIAFYPEQIKSIYNAGSFDPTVKDIRFSKRGARKPKGLLDEDYVYGRMADVTTKAFENFFEGSEVTSGDIMTITRMINGKRVKVDMPAPLVLYHNGTYDEQRGMIPMRGKGPYRRTGMHFGTKQSAEDRVPIDYGNKKHREEVGMKLASVFAEQYQLPNGDFAWENNADALTEQPNLTPKQREGFKGFETEEEAVEAGKKYVERYYAAGNYVQTAVYLSIKNPKRVQDQGLDWEKEIKKAKAEGYDGIFYYNLYEDYGSISWIAFSPNQIKSVYNTGAFDPNVEDIRLSSRQAVAALEASYVPGRMAETDTDSFKRWFKKSAVRNDDIAVMGIDPKTGLRTKTFRQHPKIVYHAGSFDRTKHIPMEESLTAFSEHPTDLMHFGTKAAAVGRTGLPQDYAEKEGLVTAAYLSIQNPKRVKDQGTTAKWRAAVEQAKLEGYDGLVYTNEYEDIGSTSYVIFNANQAKSTDNVGTFSPMLNDMRFSSRQADANAASRAIMDAWEAEKKAARAAGEEPPKRPWGNQQYGTGVWADPPNLGPRPRGRNMPGTPYGGRSGMSGKFSARQGSIEPLQEWSPQGAQLARRTAELANEISQEQGASFYQRMKNATAKIFHPLGAMTKQDEKLNYLTERYLALGKIDLSEKDATKTYEALRKLPKNEADLVFKYLTTKNAAAPTLSLPGAREAAIKAKTTISEYGDRLVAARILSPQAVAEYKGSYLPRMYMKYLLEEKGMISSGIKMDLSYVNKRQNLSAEERLALGEVKDPGFLAFMALYRPSRDLAVMGFLKNILSISRDKGYDWFLDDNLVEWKGATVTSHWLASEADAINERADYFVSDPAKQKAMNDLATEMRKLAAPGMRARVPQDYRVIPDTNRYGSLRGMIARKEVYDDIVGTGGVINADNWWDRTFGDTNSSLSKATAFWKMTKTTMNPPTQVRNFITNAAVMDISGVNTFKIPFLLGQAAKEISTNGKYFQIAQKYGISASGFSQVELREANQIMQDMLSRSGGGALNVPHMLKTVGAWTVQTAGDIYAFSEILFKTAKLIDNLQKGMKENEAALDAHDWFFDYSLVHPSIRRIRSVPFGMPFITYYYKILPKLAETLIKHPMRFAKYAALAFAIPAIFAAHNDVDDDEFEALRNSLGERIRKKQNLWAIPDKDENGNWNFVDVGYMLPWSMFQDIITSLSGGDVGAATQSFGLLGSPALSVAAAIKTNIDPFTGKKIWDDSDTPNERAKSLMNYIISVIAPPFLTGTGFFGKLIEKAEGTGLNKYGEPVDTNTQLAGRLLGFNIYSLNPQMQRMRNVSYMERDIREIEIRRTYTLKDQSLTPERRRERAAELNDYIKEKRAELQKYINETQIPEALRAGKE